MYNIIIYEDNQYIMVKIYNTNNLITYKITNLIIGMESEPDYVDTERIVHDL